MIRALSWHVRTNYSCQVQILTDGIGEGQRQQTRLVVNKADTAAPIRPCNCHMMGDLDAEHPEAGPIPVSCIASCGNWQHTKLLIPQGSRKESRKAWRQFPPVALLSSAPQLLSRFFKFDSLTVVFGLRFGYYFCEVIEMSNYWIALFATWVGVAIKASLDYAKGRAITKAQKKSDMELEKVKSQVQQSTFLFQQKYQSKKSAYEMLSKMYIAAFDAIMQLYPIIDDHVPQNDKDRDKEMTRRYDKAGNRFNQYSKRCRSDKFLYSEEVAHINDKSIDIMKTELEFFKELHFDRNLRNYRAQHMQPESDNRKALQSEYNKLMHQLRTEMIS